MASIFEHAPPRPPRGGWRQQQQAFQESEAALSRGPEAASIPVPIVAHRPSELAQYLVSAWAWGLFSAPTMQGVAQKAWNSRD